MEKYARIIYDKTNKTQRLVLSGPNDCTATVEYFLFLKNIQFTSHNFIGKYDENNYKEKTYKYAKNWEWLETIDIGA